MNGRCKTRKKLIFEKLAESDSSFEGYRKRCRDLRQASALCYKRDMRELREWISEKMRRRPRRGPNDSESTGKSGQELPANQPAPLRPTYPEAVPARAAEAPQIASAEPAAG